MTDLPGDGESLTLEQTLALAYAHLNRRERTIQEMRQYLRARGAPPGIVEAALRELSEHGYLDDGRFARLFIEDRRNLNGWGSERIRQALLERGVPAEVADAALSDPPQGELERALRVLEHRFPAGLPDRRESDRALGLLLRKGYEYDLAVDALVSHRRRGRRAA